MAMRSPVLLLSALFLAAGCVIGDSAGLDDPGRHAFASSDEPPADDDPAEGDDDDLDEDIDDPDEPADDDDDVVDDDDDDEPAWDAAPPTEVGTQIEGVILCGWMDGPHHVGFEFDGDIWQQFQVPSDAGLRAELLPCYGGQMDPQFDKKLRWSDDGAIYFQAGGLEHDLIPGSQELRWFGNVWPVGGPDEACQHALEEAGLSSPMTMTFTVDSITTPT